MSFLDEWLTEMSCSAVNRQTKEFACYLLMGSVAQSQLRKFEYQNRQGIQAPLPHCKTASLSCILSGKPGSYKSETVRLIKRVLQDLYPADVYPHDQVTREYLVSTLQALQQRVTKNPDASKPGKQFSTTMPPLPITIIIDELVNFLNRREYIEPLVGTLNTLLDQPPVYAVGTQTRKDEVVYNPVVNLIAACAPSWFKYLPEPLFTGGFAGRCLFYNVAYPSDEDRQPRGQIVQDGGVERLAEYVRRNTPKGNLVLTYEAILKHDVWEKEWGREDAHPLSVLDEWYKRRLVQTTRLAGAIALAHDSTTITPQWLDDANEHMTHVGKTLEEVWFEVEGDQSTQHKMLQLALANKAMTWAEIEDLAVKYLKSPVIAHRIIDWWVKHDVLLEGKGSRWYFRSKPLTEVKRKPN